MKKLMLLWVTVFLAVGLMGCALFKPSNAYKKSKNGQMVTVPAGLSAKRIRSDFVIS